jgi:hypothetical protein
MSVCVCCGENVGFVDEQTCDSCEEIMCDDCYLTHDGICDECSVEDNVDIDEVSSEDYNSNVNN